MPFAGLKKYSNNVAVKKNGFHLLDLLMVLGLMIYGDVYKTNYQLIFMEQIG